MKEAPLIFRPDMVRAILAGKKTQTRRLVDLEKFRVFLPQEVKPDVLPDRAGWPLRARPGSYRATLNRSGAISVRIGEHQLGVKPGEFHIHCRYADGDTHLGQYGDRKLWTIVPKERSTIWVREKWCLAHPVDTDCLAVAADRPRGPEKYRWIDAHEFAYYAATDPDVVRWDSHDKSPWQSPMYMPRWASRILLDVASVRLERLQDITEDDAKAEGVEPKVFTRKCYPSSRAADVETPSYRDGYIRAWSELHGDESWDTNPWIWAITFRRIETAQRAA